MPQDEDVQRVLMINRNLMANLLILNAEVKALLALCEEMAEEAGFVQARSRFKEHRLSEIRRMVDDLNDSKPDLVTILHAILKETK